MSDRDVLEKVARAIYEVNIEARKVPHEWLVYITGPRYEKLTTASHENYERAARAAVEVVLEEAREVVARVLVDHFGERQGIPRGRDEWGPVCAGCGAEEYRIDGFCTIECREASYLTVDILEALSVLSDVTGDKE